MNKLQKNKVKTFNKQQFISNNMKDAYIRAKKKSSKTTEEHQGSAYEYADDILEDMVDETSSSAQSFAKNNFKKSIQKKRTVDSKRRVSVIKGKDIPVQNMYTNNVVLTNTPTHKSMVERAKDRFVKNSIKAKTVGTTTIKEKIIGFVKGGSKAVVNNAKLAIANTKLLVAALVGTGGIAILFTIIICIIGLVMGSSFGIFMATEDTGTGYTLNEVIQEINEEYLAEIEKIKTEVSHDDFEISGEAPNWKDILAVYAVKVTTAHEGAEVVTVDEEKSELIREVFWDMTEIIYETEFYEETTTIETIDEQGNIIEQEVTVTKTKLIINKKNKTATEAANEYEFDENQYMQLQELICDNNSGMWIFAEKT
ncbi:MAG: hypothetical protein IJN77_00780 [Oscillospiraceae bacterium]|nr:hypothetical protein [Oscillospiraceae bacterium]